MNCQTIQTDLLGLERPAQPTPELSAHLAGCQTCREWLQQLLLLEDHVARLPVPPSSGKASFLASFLGGAKQTTSSTRPASNGSIPRHADSRNQPVWARHERRLKRVALALSLTAALVMVAVGLWAWRFAGPPTPDVRPIPADNVLLTSLMKRNLKLAATNTPKQKLETLADLADDLHGETRTLMQAANPNDLVALAQLYRKVVLEGIVAQAQAVPAADRAAILNSIAERLTRTGNEASELADRLPAAASSPLRDIATAARDGDRQLRTLLGGVKS